MLRPLTDEDPRIIGPYRLHNRIGAGGMGVVYLGFGPDERPVAVKVPGTAHVVDPEFRHRFRAEVSAARGVDGPSVARVIDAEVDGPQPWLATEYVQGPTLRSAVGDNGPLPARQIEALAADLARALVAIHSAGVIHRDLKPANIVMSWSGPKVIDFGVARVADHIGLTTTGKVVGTVAWMAPEQISGHQVGPPADIFAWGSCIVFAATGRRPFRGDAQEVVALQIVTAGPDLDGVPERLLHPVRAALVKSPEDRPCAAALLAMLQEDHPPTLHDQPSDDDRAGDDRAGDDETRAIEAPGPVPRSPRPDVIRPGSTRRSAAVEAAVGLLAAGFAGAAAVGAATAGVWPAALGPLGATVVAAVCARLATPGRRPLAVGVTVVAAATGSCGGLVLARIGALGQPARMLVELALAGVLMSIFTRAMAVAPARPAVDEKAASPAAG